MNYVIGLGLWAAVFCGVAYVSDRWSPVVGVGGLIAVLLVARLAV